MQRSRSAALEKIASIRDAIGLPGRDRTPDNLLEGSCFLAPTSFSPLRRAARQRGQSPSWLTFGVDARMSSFSSHGQEAYLSLR